MLKFIHTIPFAGPLQQILKPALHAGFSQNITPYHITHNINFFAGERTSRKRTGLLASSFLLDSI
ncbi:hypothetical protein, partial [Anaerovibrio lipolyticus]|uniref:hypothetical protein n=1 Tax=Anaerovibrio lipolyticus TaxID=82374 RepID=UPI0023F0B11C